jgi:group II intron maturase
MRPVPATSRGTGETKRASTVLALSFVSGFVAIGYRIIGYRVLGVLLKSTAHAFGMMLFVFLSGIALSSFMARRSIDAPHQMRRFGLTQIGTAAWLASLLGAFFLFGAVPGLEHLIAVSFFTSLHPNPLLGTGHIGVLTLYSAVDILLWPALFFTVPTVLIGIGFPNLIRALGLSATTSQCPAGTWPRPSPSSRLAATAWHFSRHLLRESCGPTAEPVHRCIRKRPASYMSRTGSSSLATRLREEKDRPPAYKHTARTDPSGPYVVPRQKSVDRFKDQIRSLTRRSAPVRLREMIEAINPIIRGWVNYYRKAHVRKLFHRLDGWIERRLRSFVAKKWRNAAWRIYPLPRLVREFGLPELDVTKETT